MKRIVLICSLLIVFLAGSIAYADSKTKLKDVWKDKAYQSTVKKIVVFCAMNDEVRRVLYEGEVIRQLKARGINAMAGYVIIPQDKFVDKETALTKIRDLEVDAVLAIKLIDQFTAQKDISPPDGANRSGFYEYVYDVQTKDKDAPAYLETNLFDVKTGQRVWTARSETKVDAADQKLFAEFSELIIDLLASDTIIK